MNLGPNSFKVGTVAIIGRANVGKSTLLNQLVCFKLSGVSSKRQTTRHKILGVLTGDSYQAAFLDTPGMLLRNLDELNRYLVSRVSEAMEESTLVVLLVEPRNAGDIERWLVEKLGRLGKPAILTINKIDRVRKSVVLPVMEEYNGLYPFKEIVPISALQMDGVDRLLELIVEHLPEGEPMFAPETLTDRTENFLVSELIREKVFQMYGQEVPYSTAVEIDNFVEESEEHGGKDYISATIYVEKVNQRKILIGQGGQALKKVGIEARQDIEGLLGRPVHLEMWVKIKLRWRKDTAFLNAIGY